MPSISIIVPVYKVEAYIHRCIDSILSQTFEDFELILVDDGSPDRCGEMCDEYAKTDRRIRVIHQDNQGQAVARNHGVSVANGTWICFVDSDDAVHPQMLERLYTMAQQTNAQMCLCGSRHEPYEGMINVSDDTYTVESGDDEATVLRILQNGVARYWTPWAKLIAKSLVEKHPFPIGRVYEDNATVYRWICDAKTIVDCSEQLYIHYRNEDGTTFNTYSYFTNPNDETMQGFTLKGLDYLLAIEEQIWFYRQRQYANVLNALCAEYLSISMLCYEAVLKKFQRPDLIRSMKKRMERMVWKNRRAFGSVSAYALKRCSEQMQSKRIKLFLIWRDRFGK